MKKLILLIIIIPSLAIADWSETPVTINSNGNSTDYHYCSGKRIVAYGSTVIVVAAEGSQIENLYRSTNSGSTWAQLEDYSGFSGSLVIDSDGTVYYFFKDSNTLYMSRFAYDGTPPTTATTLESGLASTSLAMYDVVFAGIDQSENLYVTYSDGNASYVVVSTDGGDTWGTPSNLTSGLSESGYYYAYVDVTDDDTVVIVHSHRTNNGTGDRDIHFSFSENQGSSWTRRDVSDNTLTQNCVLVPISGDEVWLFCQQQDTLTGLVYNTTDDLGQTWGGWTSIDSGYYADPGAARLSNGDIFVAYRDGTGGGSGHREKAALYDLSETSWSTVKDYSQAPYSYERPGTRSAVFFQTWHNGGSNLMWSWLQDQNSGANRNTIFDSNPDLSLMQQATVSATRVGIGSKGVVGN